MSPNFVMFTRKGSIRSPKVTLGHFHPLISIQQWCELEFYRQFNHWWTTIL